MRVGAHFDVLCLGYVLSVLDIELRLNLKDFLLVPRRDLAELMLLNQINRRHSLSLLLLFSFLVQTDRVGCSVRACAAP